MFINRRFSCITQLKVKVFSIIITAVLLSNIGVMAGENQLSGDSRLNCVKEEEGAPITAIATLDGGRAAIAGDQNGDIYQVNANTNKAVKILSTGCGAIDSAVIDASIDRFYFVADGKVYLYDNNNMEDISGNISSERVKKLKVDKRSGTSYSITESKKVYSLSGFCNWVPTASDTAEKIVQSLSSEEKKNSSLLLNSDSGPLSSSDISCSAVNGENIFIGKENGQLYMSSLYEPQPMTAKAEYISDAVGVDTNRVIYRITIDGYKLNTDDIFTKGYNGFKYTLSSDDPQYNKDAYPINGVVYNSDGKDDASLQNREISFLWLGPKCANDGDHKLTVNELAYNFTTTASQQIDSTVIKLPAAKVLPDYSNYDIEIKPESGPNVSGEGTGTCAIPFSVTIRDAATSAPIDADNDIYNHLLFYTVDGSVVNKDGLIGCDPFSVKSGVSAILPSECVELDRSYIKYGTLGLTCKTNGRTFYAYMNLVDAPANSELVAGLLYKGDLSVKKTFTLAGSTDPVAIAADYGINNPGGRTFTFSGGVSGSNWQGDEDGLYGGYLDYQLTSCGHGQDSYKGIFVYLPEGLNTRDIDARKDLRSSSLKIGYYFDPQAGSKSPLRTASYHLNDTSSYCDQMRNQKLYAVLFDQYGRCATNYSLNDNDSVKDSWELRKKGTWDPNQKMVMQLGNFFNTPIIMGSTSDSKENNYGVTQRGLFVPPITSGINATFITDINVWLNGNNDGNYKIGGYKLTTSPQSAGNTLFYNTLNIDIKNNASIALNVTDKNLNPLASYTPDGVISLNGICVKDPGLWVTAWLDSWTIFHINSDIVEKYAYWYSFDYYRDGGHGSLSPDGNYYGEYMKGRVWYDVTYKCIDNVTCFFERKDSSIPPKPASVWPLVK